MIGIRGAILGRLAAAKVEILEIELIEFAAAAVIVFVAAAAQGTVGLGFNIVAVPAMSLINPLLAPVPQLILSLPQVIALVVREHTEVDRTGVLWILLGRLPGAALGVWLLSVATQGMLDMIIGLLVLAAVIVLASGVHLTRNRSIEFGAGVFAGVASYVSTIGGPPVALLYSREEGPTIRATLGLVFLMGMSVTLTVRIVAGDITRMDVVYGLSLMPAAAMGFALSSWIKERIAPSHLRLGVFVLSSLAAVALLGRAAFG